MGWRPPPLNFAKINFDGSKYHDGSAACGFVIRDLKSEVVVAGCKALPSAYSIIQTEAGGPREAVKAALSLNLTNLRVEGDNINVINSISKIWKPPWTINALIVDVDLDLAKFSKVSIAHCFKEANRAANFMAHKGHGVPNLLYQFPPFCIDFFLIIRKDVLCWPPD